MGARARSFHTVLHAAGGDLFVDGFVAEVITDAGPIELTDFDKTVFYHGSIRGMFTLPKTPPSIPYLVRSRIAPRS
jgi:hypothetical protein